MKGLHFLLFLNLILFLCISCISSASKGEVIWQEQKPTFVKATGIHLDGDSIYMSRQIICFDLDIKALWEVGNRADELNDHLASTTSLIGDGKSMPIDTASNSLLSLNFVFDENGNEIGSYSDLKLCFNIDSIGIGEHAASLAVTTLSGVEHTATMKLDLS